MVSKRWVQDERQNDGRALAGTVERTLVKAWDKSLAMLTWVVPPPTRRVWIGTQSFYLLSLTSGCLILS